MKQVELSPDFDYENYETILEWAKEKYGAAIEYDSVSVSHGEEAPSEEYSGYFLRWDFGTMLFSKDEQKARKEAAMFIYLWSRGVHAQIANSLSGLYVDYVKITNL